MVDFARPAPVRACTPRKIDRAQAVSLAVREHALNHADGLACLHMPAAQRAALVVGKNWKPGRTLRIGFSKAVDRALRNELLEAAAEWMKYAFIFFKGVESGDCEIRVDADPAGGSWSYIGTDALGIPANEPTLNLGWPDDYGRSLHELGHALGLIHEHQNPLAHIPWNRQACYAFYGGPPNNWSPSEVDEQVLDVDSEPLTNGGFDRLSIMEYPIDARLVTDPSYAVGWNTDLSAHDKIFIAARYPGVWTPPVIPAQPVSTSPPVTTQTPATPTATPPPATPPPAVTTTNPPSGGFMDYVEDILAAVKSGLSTAGTWLVHHIDWGKMRSVAVAAALSGGPAAIFPALIAAAPTFLITDDLGAIGTQVAGEVLTDILKVGQNLYKLVPFPG